MFHEGGWVMYPIVATAFLALCVLLERTIWWLGFKKNIRSRDQIKAREALGTGNFGSAWDLSNKSSDPFVKNLGDGISHAHTSLLAAMQLDATHWIERSEARMWVLGTIITLAPLLGLFGTVVGLMGSFASLGDDQLAVSKVTGGIAEALIATAAGICIAISCLLPFNYFRKRVSALRGEFERWINHTELLAASAKAHGHDLEEFSTKLHISR
ncbi:MotA/TolQ/ExbB proton channel family protein [Luteolibacter sp. SL250]|uniref:MotA/TolQ/ExbB proton channel family protein n=1 Tax=Luteolibacter sp. SL250 TaxID=2995170 RepID=UPI00226FFC0E|nr:MotA/TolQ/ExbB proton channel family protein [Luteolibacter sp. SL250]WAC17968.1 MotA/TolQ/ExbB proton channel family protein [Luteolibacter sp. SL250]